MKSWCFPTLAASIGGIGIETDKLDPVTLITMIAIAAVARWLGKNTDIVVTLLPKRKPPKPEDKTE